MSAARVIHHRERRAARLALARDSLAAVALPPPSVRRLPMTRAECEHGERPCPYVSCRHHLFLDVAADGHIQFNGALVGANDPNLDAMADTCSLDVAERTDGLGGPEVGAAMGISKEATHVIEKRALAKLGRLRSGGLPAEYAEGATVSSATLRAQIDDDRHLALSPAQLAEVG